MATSPSQEPAAAELDSAFKNRPTGFRSEAARLLATGTTTNAFVQAWSTMTRRNEGFIARAQELLGKSTPGQVLTLAEAKSLAALYDKLSPADREAVKGFVLWKLQTTPLSRFAYDTRLATMGSPDVRRVLASIVLRRD